jgi:hypothetical protein
MLQTRHQMKFLKHTLPENRMFAVCKAICRVPFHGHSANHLFDMCQENSLRQTYVCCVPNQPTHGKLQHTVNIFRLTWGDKKKRTAQRGTRQRCLLCRVPTVRLTAKMPQLLRQAVARLVRRVSKRTHGKSIFLPCVLRVCRVQTSWHTVKI